MNNWVSKLKKSSAKVTAVPLVVELELVLVEFSCHLSPATVWRTKLDSRLVLTDDRKGYFEFSKDSYLFEKETRLEDSVIVLCCFPRK